MHYPRILVVSNNSFSLTNSNGRTLGSFFVGWPKSHLAQFCISTDGPNFELCDNYYCLSDNIVLKSFLKLKVAKGKKLKQEDFYEQKKSPVKRNIKTPLKAIIRNFVWKMARWESLHLREWITSFRPDILLFQSGDSIFMLNIAMAISQRYNIPIVIFNTEGYYFFKKNYMKKGILDKSLFSLYQNLYKKQFRKIVNMASLSIYGNELLKNDYDKEFNTNSMVLYTGSTLPFEEKPFAQSSPRFSYIGNLGHNRYKALMEIGDVLQSINKNFYLDVYGNTTSKIENILRNYPGLRFHGFINYEEVKRVISESDVLFHAETQEDSYRESLRYGFSTKIADSLSSGKSFFLYSSPDIACAVYIKKTGAAWFADNKNSLKEKLICLLKEKEMREEILIRAKQIVAKNHSIPNNCMTFKKILDEIAFNSNNN